MGYLKSLLAQMRQHCSNSLVPSVHRARWFNARARSVLAFYGPFLLLGVKVTEKLQTIKNEACRIVAGVRERYNVSSLLSEVSELFDLDVERSYYASIVKRLGHVFRQPGTTLNCCANSPFFYELQRQRSLGGRHWVSNRSLRTAELLQSCGLDVPFESSGRRDSRTSSGSLVHFWASLWFCSMRDSEGLGWVFQKDDLGRIEERIQILFALFSFKKVRGQKLPLTDIDGAGARAILDKDSSCQSSSTSSSTEETSSDSSSTSSSNDRRRARPSVSGIKLDSPKEDGYR